ncbi:MAG: hypothetical protein KF780_11340 [Sphingomonas sp.]|nr:hypothetical protein [Sphingomonas sp.]
MFAKFLAPMAGAALIAAPAVAQSAAALSVQPAVIERAAGADEGNELAGGAWIAPVLAAAIVIGGVLLAAGVFDDDDAPVSP